MLGDSELGAWGRRARGCRAERSGAVPAGAPLSQGDPTLVPPGVQGSPGLAVGTQRSPAQHVAPTGAQLPLPVPAVPGLTHTLCLPQPKAVGTQLWVLSTSMALEPARRCPHQQPCRRRGSAPPAPQWDCAAPSRPPCRGWQWGCSLGRALGPPRRCHCPCFRVSHREGLPSPGMCGSPCSTGLSGDGSADVSHFLHFFPHSSLPGAVSGK